MRTLSEAEKYWHQLDDFHSLTDLKIAVSSHNEPQITAGLRSVCWKIFLLFKTLDRSTWPDKLSESRDTYNALRSRYLRAIEHPDEFDSSVDPLSENEEVALRADESLRAEIFQDIERCMPDNVYFRQPATQNMMLDILFVWCKMHPDVGYRQGMHEILAPVLWVVERDAVDLKARGNGDADGTLAAVLDSRCIEQDSYTLFSTIMKTAMSFYAPAETGSVTKDTPMLARSARIFERYLPRVDPGLSTHLVKLEIVPQIFLLRWIRLLFGREFPLDSVLNMWDALFAIDSSLELVDMISIAMLLRIRWQLVAADTNEAFTLLLRYPEPDAPAYTFIKDALYLRDHLTPEGGAEIITRYGKKAPPIEEKAPEIRSPSPSPSYVSSRTRHTIGSPRAFVSQQGGLETLIQNAAKGVMDRGSQWNVSKAIRDAVGEVKKNVEAYQSNLQSGQITPRSGGREFRGPARGSITGINSKPPLERSQTENAIKKIEGLEKRNKGLAKMLEGAVAELWDYHKERSEIAKEGKEGKEGMEKLSLAIAKVQFVQVYLEDSSIPLPVDGLVEEAPSTPGLASPLVPERTSSAVRINATTQLPPTPSATAESEAKASASTPKQEHKPQPLETKQTDKPQPLEQKQPTTQARTLAPPPRPRPLLSSPSFSWMLGQTEEAEPPRSTFAKASEHSALASDERRRMRAGKGFLFGDDEGVASGPVEGKAKVKRGSVSRKGGKGGKSGSESLEVEEEVIDLDQVGGGR